MVRQKLLNDGKNRESKKFLGKNSITYFKKRQKKKSGGKDKMTGKIGKLKNGWEKILSFQNIGKDKMTGKIRKLKK